MQRKKTYFIETWGCQMNVHDSEKLAGRLKAMGYVPASRPAEAGLIILNTCSVREKAEEKVFARLDGLKQLKGGRPLVIGLAGCVAQQEGSAVFKRAPYVDFVLGTQSLVCLPEVLERVHGGGARVAEVGRHSENLDVSTEHIDRVPGVKAYVTIMEGCDNFCAFCIVPFTRGRERNRPVEDIVREARALGASGFKEIQLLGQNVNSYRDPVDGRSFAQLLDAVHEVEGIERLRFTSPHPKDFDRAVLERYRDLPKLCPHMHLPAQSGSTRILRQMRRGYTREHYLAKVDAVRELVPDIALTTDLIVGFPGETEEEFEETLSLVQTVGFDSVFSFKYSPRPMTLASRKMPDDVPEEIKRRRLSRLHEVQRRIQLRRHARWMGRSLQVLVDGRSKKQPEVLSGRSAYHHVVNFEGDPEWIGRFVEVHVTRVGPNSLFGEALRPL